MKESTCKSSCPKVTIDCIQWISQCFNAGSDLECNKLTSLGTASIQALIHIILISPSFSNVHVFCLVMSVGQRKNSESLRGIKPQIFGFHALMLCPWATDSTVSVEKVWVKRYTAMLESNTGHWVKFGTQTNPFGFHCSETFISQQFLFWIRKELLGEKFTPIIRKPSWCVNSWLKPRRHWILPQEW